MVQKRLAKTFGAVILATAVAVSASCNFDLGSISGTADTTTAPPEEITTTTAAPSTTTSETELTVVSTSETEPVREDLAIRKGVWWTRAEDGSDGTYYIFEDSSGGILNQSMGIGSPFEYEISGSDVMFHIASADNNTPAKLTVTDDDTMILEFTEKGLTQILRFVQELSGNFVFFSNEELMTAAASYYSNEHDGLIPVDVQCFVEEDSRIRITLTGIADEVYYIDRFTGRGTDSIGNNIDLGLAYAGSAEDMSDPIIPAAWSPVVIQRQVMLDDNEFFGVRYLGYIDPNAVDIDIYRTYIDNILSLTGTSEDFPFTAELPDDRFVATGAGTELYLVIPFDENGTVTVKGRDFDSSGITDSGLVDGLTFYSSGDAEPFLLKCNVSEIWSDAKVIITNSSGESVEWSPAISGENGKIVTANSGNAKVYDFTDYYMLAGTEDAPVG